MSPIVACQDGLCSAVPQPIEKVNASNSQGVSQPSNAMNVSKIDTQNMKLCAISITRRRSKLSAKTPARSEKIMIGSATEPCTKATMFCESDSEVISQAAPTAWTNPPKFDASAAIQSERNVWLRNRIRGEIWLCCTNRLNAEVPLSPDRLIPQLP